MFLSLFSNRDYAEELWPAVFILESLTRVIICRDPEFYASQPESAVKRRIEDDLELVQFPPKELKLDSPGKFIEEFLDDEVGSLKSYASILIQKLDSGMSLSAILYPDDSSIGAIRLCIEKSQSFRAVALEEWWSSWMNRFMERRNTDL